MSTEVSIPGKAFEIAKNAKELGVDLRLKLINGDRRKKGRGYRVFVTLENDQISALANFFGSLTLRGMTLVDRQAVVNTTERLCEIVGAQQPERPKPEPKAPKQSVGMRDGTQNAIWELLSPLIEIRKCRCGLRKGMSLEELSELGAGCTDPHDLKYKVLKLPKPPRNTRIMAHSEGSGFVCPVLDSYRRSLIRLGGRKDDAKAL